MDILKSLFPWSFKNKTMKDLIVSILIYMAINIVGGLVFGLLLPKSKTAAYLVSAALFAAIHVVGYAGSVDLTSLVLAFIQYLPAGLVLGWAYEKGGTIIAPMVIHMAINAMGIWAMR